MPTISFSIGGPQMDISGKSSKEVLDLVKKEYNKKVEEKKMVKKDSCKFCGNKNYCKSKNDGKMIRLAELVDGTFSCDEDDCIIKTLKDCRQEQEETAFCAVGEHYVSRDTMWQDFADCKNCCSEKEYRDRHIYG